MSNYRELCDELFSYLEDYLDNLDDDIDYESNSDICEITLVNGSKVIINRQPPNEEIWLATREGGFHYRHDGSEWVDTRDGSKLLDRLTNTLK